MLNPEVRLNTKFLLNLHKRRLEKGLTPEELASRAKLSKATLRKMDDFEYRSTPNLRTVIKLAAALECTVCDLLKGVE